MEAQSIDVDVKVAVADAKMVNMWADFEVEVHANHPLYLYPSDNSSMSSISIKLTRPENYPMWSCHAHNLAR